MSVSPGAGCRSCGARMGAPILDLGRQPSANRYLTRTEAEGAGSGGEVLFPLRLYVCASCWLVQIADVNRAEDIFTPDYAYYASHAASWVEHAARYAAMATERFGLGPSTP